MNHVNPKKSGMTFFQNFVSSKRNLNHFLDKLQKTFKNFNFHQNSPQKIAISQQFSKKNITKKYFFRLFFDKIYNKMIKIVKLNVKQIVE